LKKANIACGFVGMAFSAFAFIRTLGFRQFPLVPIGPEFFPRYLAAGLFICSAVLIIQALLSKPQKEQKAPTISPFDKGMQRLLVGIAIIIVYAILWEPLGFLIITPVAMAAIMLLLGYRRYFMMALFSLGTTLVIFGAFSFFLNVNMPLGILRGLL
jgi:putative tricarboxylic transport membrane protein